MEINKNLYPKSLKQQTQIIPKSWQIGPKTSQNHEKCVPKRSRDPFWAKTAPETEKGPQKQASGTRFGVQLGAQIDPQSDQQFGHFFDHVVHGMVLPFWAHLGAVWASKTRLSAFTKTSQNHDTLIKIEGSAPHGPLQNRSQNASKIQARFLITFLPILLLFWEPFGHPNPPKNVYKFRPWKRTKNSIFCATPPGCSPPA